MKYLVLTICLAAGAAQAQYRCGNTYQQTPCPGAVVVPKPAPAAGAKREVQIGMGFAQVYDVLGPADKTNTFTRAGAKTEQLIWRGRHQTTYVYLTDGKVSSIDYTDR